MLETALGAQYLKTALARWRENNPWANHIPWERVPQRYKNQIEQTAKKLMTSNNSVSPPEGLVHETEKQAA
jgi:hypothetical protein